MGGTEGGKEIYCTYCEVKDKMHKQISIVAAVEIKLHTCSLGKEFTTTDSPI